MTAKKLGRGLDVLITRSSSASSAPATPPPSSDQGNDHPRTAVVSIAPDRIDPNPGQARKSFDNNLLEELGGSIARDGLLQPVLVRRKGERFELIAGERRLRAAKALPLQTIPAIVLDADDQRAQELSLIENLQRSDLNLIELADGYRCLLEQYGLTQEELAKRLGMHRSTIANTLRFLDLPEEIQASLARREITPGHAKIILSVHDPDERLRLFRRIRDDDLSIREAEAESQPEPGEEGKRKKRRRKPRPRRAAHLAEIEERLTQALGTKVTIQERRGRGTISIEFYSREELERLIEVLTVGETMR